MPLFHRLLIMCSLNRTTSLCCVATYKTGDLPTMYINKSIIEANEQFGCKKYAAHGKEILKDKSVQVQKIPVANSVECNCTGQNTEKLRFYSAENYKNYNYIAAYGGKPNKTGYIGHISNVISRNSSENLINKTVNRVKNFFGFKLNQKPGSFEVTGNITEINAKTVKKEAVERFGKHNNFKINKENADLMHILLTQKTTDGKFKFDAYDVESLSSEKLDSETVKLLAKDQNKNANGDCRFNAINIEELSDKKLDQETVRLLAKDQNKDTNGNFRFSAWNIKGLADKTIRDQKTVKILAEDKSRNRCGDFKFDWCNISAIAETMQKYKKDSDAYKILSDVMNNPDFRSREYFIIEAGDICNGCSKYPNAVKIIKDTGLAPDCSKHMNFELFFESVEHVVKGTKPNETELNEKQIHLFKEYLKSAQNININDGFYINYCIRRLKPENYEKAEKYMKSFKQLDISSICEAAEIKTSEMGDFLISPSYMRELKQNSAGKYQKEVVEILNPENMNKVQAESLLSSNLTKNDFLASVKKLSKSTFKLAYDKPNQYLSGIDLKYSTPVNGKIPELPIEELARERAEIVKFFQENTCELIRILKYIDTDTVSHMMDKRTDLFKEALDNLNKLNDENLSLLSKMLKCKSEKTGKPLSPKEKIELCQIMEIFQSAEIDTSILKDCSSKGMIDLAVPKQKIQNEILKTAGVDLNSTEVIKNNKNFNEEFSYLILLNSGKKRNLGLDEMIQSSLPQIKDMINKTRNNAEARNSFIDSLEQRLNDSQYVHYITKEQKKVMEELLDMFKNPDDYSDKQIISKMAESLRLSAGFHSNGEDMNTVIKSAACCNFKEFISDTSNKYGRTNLKTKQSFEKNGLNYEKWLAPEIEEEKLTVAGKDMTIRIWDRNPQEDLFMGNKTTCCTAIGCGNGDATPVYLLNTSFNVVDLYDANGNVKGMSRVFMSKIDGKPALIMDNIELNKTYIKGMSEPQKKEIRDGFFNYMHKYAEQITGDKNAQVYFYAHDVHVPTQDLKKTEKVTDFIGGLSRNDIYINSAGCRWINPAKLKDEGEIEWLAV